MEQLMSIEIVKDKAISSETSSFYTVKVNGEVLLECLSAEEVKELSIRDIVELMQEFYWNK